MNTLEDCIEILKLAKALGRDEAIKRLVPPQGSDSGDLLPDTRSGSQQVDTTNSGSEKPLPDQGWGAMAGLLQYLEKLAAFRHEESLTYCGDDHVMVKSIARQHAAQFTKWADAVRAMAPRTQSVADADESECCDSPALGYLNGVLHCINCHADIPMSRKERSVSGNH